MDSRPMATVACVGIAVMDLLFEVDRLPEGAGKFYATSFREIGGGVAANAAVAVARLGARARYIGRVGNDSLGEQIVSGLADSGVEVSAVERVADVTSPVSAVIVDAAGERTIVNHTRPELFIGGDLAPARAIADADALLVDVRWPHGAAAALETAADLGIPAVFDFDRPMDKSGLALASTASHVAFSQPALAATAGTSDPVAALEQFAELTEAWLAVTVGGDGVYWKEGDSIRHLPAFAVEVVDTVGAGDVFHGALTLALAEGQPEADALRFASAAAALKCTRPGARDGAPTRAEVEAMLVEGD